MPEDDDDFLDGWCDAELVVKHPVTDEETPFVVLFCDDLDGDDEHVLDAEKLVQEAHDWHALFDRMAPDA